MIQFSSAAVILSLIIGTILIIFIGYQLIQHFDNFFKLNPYLVRDTMDIEERVVDRSKIFKSYNQENGLSFSYTGWLFIRSKTFQSGSDNDNYFHVFSKGSRPSKMKDLFSHDSTLVMCPGVFIHPTTNRMYIIINTLKNPREVIEIDNIPIEKWFCLAITVNNRNVDVFFNGSLKISHELDSLPRQNQGNIYIGSGITYQGNLSRLRYYNYAITLQEMETYISTGPSTKMENINTGMTPPYLAGQWWTTPVRS